MTKFEITMEENNVGENITPYLDVLLCNVPAYNRLRHEKGNAAPLARYAKYTLAKFIAAYHNDGLKGKKVYDTLISEIAPQELLPEPVKVKPQPIERYSDEDLMSQAKREIPYVSNVHQSIGKLMDSAIAQAIMILEKHSSVASAKYADVLRYYFLDHKTVDDITKIVKDSRWNVQGNILNKFMKGEDYSAGICIAAYFKQKVVALMDSMLFKACDEVFDENDIDTPEKVNFAANLAGYDVISDMKEWGNVMILIQDSSKDIARQHLISLKKAICDAIVPVQMSVLIEKTKADFVKKNIISTFNSQIIERFADSHPWIQKDDEDRYFIITSRLDKSYQRQGRIIYEAGAPIHHDSVRAIYKSLYGEDYKTAGIQSGSLNKRVEHDFFSYGKTGLWYYSESGVKIKPANEVIAKFVDEHICFYWKDLSAVVGQLCKINKKFTKSRIRLEVTNLCYVDINDTEHFVKKGEEANYPLFSWRRANQNRTNWCVNHAYEMLKDAPNGVMSMDDFEEQFKQDLIETGRPIKVLEDIKYKHSGSSADEKIFIRENNTIRINEDVVQNKYNGDLSLFGRYRKFSEFYNIIFSLAMTELRKQQENKMLLVDFISLALENIESEGKLSSPYIRKIFENKDVLPQGLTRYNENGSVYIKYNPAVATDDTADDMQYAVSAQPSDAVQDVPQLVVSDEIRQPVSYTTRFNWGDVKRALKADLAFYDSPFWYSGITSDEVLDKFVNTLSSSTNNNLNDLVPQIIYEFHYARIDRYDLNQYMRNLPIAFEALLRDIYESCHRPTKSRGIYNLCVEGFNDYALVLKSKDKRGFGRILNDLVNKRNLLLHGANLELSPVTLVQNVVEYIALFVYTVNKYALKM